MFFVAISIGRIDETRLAGERRIWPKTAQRLTEKLFAVLLMNRIARIASHLRDGAQESVVKGRFSFLEMKTSRMRIVKRN